MASIHPSLHNKSIVVFGAEGSEQGIRVNAVSPGPIDTPMADIGFGSTQNLRATLATTPAKRSGTPNEVADLVLFLFSDGARYINGREFTIDGGFTLT